MRSCLLPPLYKYNYADCMILPGKEIGLTGVYFVPKSGESENYVILGIWVAACGDVHYVIMCPNLTVTLYVQESFVAKFKNFHCRFDKVVEISEETCGRLLKDFTEAGKRTDSRGSNSFILELTASPYTSTEVLKEGYCVVNNINHMSMLLEMKGICLNIPNYSVTYINIILMADVGPVIVKLWKALIIKDRVEPIISGHYVILKGHTSAATRYIFVGTIVVSKSRSGNQFVVLALDTYSAQLQIVRLVLHKIISSSITLAETSIDKSLLFVSKLLEDCPSAHINLLMTKFPTSETLEVLRSPSPSSLSPASSDHLSLLTAKFPSPKGIPRRPSPSGSAPTASAGVVSTDKIPTQAPKIKKRMASRSQSPTPFYDAVEHFPMKPVIPYGADEEISRMKKEIIDLRSKNDLAEILVKNQQRKVAKQEQQLQQQQLQQQQNEEQKPNRYSCCGLFELLDFYRKM
jgi:hypothetical protein